MSNDIIRNLIKGIRNGHIYTIGYSAKHHTIAIIKTQTEEKLSTRLVSMHEPNETIVKRFVEAIGELSNVE